MGLMDLALSSQQMFLVESWNPHLSVLLVSHLEFLDKNQDSSSSLLLVDHGKYSHLLSPCQTLRVQSDSRIVTYPLLCHQSLPSCLTCLHGFLLSGDTPVHYHLTTSRNIYEDLDSLKTLSKLEVGSSHPHLDISREAVGKTTAWQLLLPPKKSPHKVEQI